MFSYMPMWTFAFAVVHHSSLMYSFPLYDYSPVMFFVTIWCIVFHCMIPQLCSLWLLLLLFSCYHSEASKRHFLDSPRSRLTGWWSTSPSASETGLGCLPKQFCSPLLMGKTSLLYIRIKIRQPPSLCWAGLYEMVIFYSFRLHSSEC